MLVVSFNSVGCNDHAVWSSSGQPRCFFLNSFVGFQHRGLYFGVGVIKSQNELAIVHLTIRAVDDETSRVTKGKRTVWVGRETQHNLPFRGVVQRCQPLAACLDFSLFEQVRGFFLKDCSNRFKAILVCDLIGIVHFSRHQTGNEFAVLLEFIAHGHDTANHGTHGSLPFVFKGILKRDMADEVADGLVGLPFAHRSAL